MKFARLDPITGQIASYVEITLAQFEALAGNPKRAYLREFLVNPQPAPSAAQFVREGPIVLTATTAMQTWELADKTAAQLAAEAATTQEAADLAQLRLVYAALLAGTGTAAERITRIERSVAYLLRKYGAHLAAGG